MERDLQLSLVSSIHNIDNHDDTIYAAMYVGLYPDCFCDVRDLYKSTAMLTKDRL